ncbi:hypothetical protein KKC94_04780 [Patescibacteria group bacterium]|nr:hypothetical protein [Patescibacteria group bacterium]
MKRKHILEISGAAALSIAGAFAIANLRVDTQMPNLPQTVHSSEKANPLKSPRNQDPQITKAAQQFGNLLRQQTAKIDDLKTDINVATEIAASIGDYYADKGYDVNYVDMNVSSDPENTMQTRLRIFYEEIAPEPLSNEEQEMYQQMEAELGTEAVKKILEIRPVSGAIDVDVFPRFPGSSKRTAFVYNPKTQRSQSLEGASDEELQQKIIEFTNELLK